MRALCTTLLLTVALAAREARAGVRVDLVRGDGAETCGDGASLRRELLRRLGAHAFEGEVAQVIEVLLLRDNGRWVARVRLRDDQGSLIGARDLSSEAPTCGPLGAALSLTLALLIDPDAPPPPATPREVALVCPPPPAPHPTPRTPRRPVVQVSAEATAVWGVVPDVAPGVALRTELALSRGWRLAVGVTTLPTSRVDAPASRFAFGWTAASLGACVSPTSNNILRFDVCASARLGALHVSVDGVAAQHTGDRLWASAHLEPRLRARVVGPVVVTAEANVGVPFTRESFGVAGTSAAVFEVSPVTLAASLGAGVELP
jgi:hypothetical protein